MNLSPSDSIPNDFSVSSCDLIPPPSLPTPYLPSSITVDGLVQILPLRWMNSLFLDLLRYGTSHAICNKTIAGARTHTHICTHFISHSLEWIYMSRRNHVRSGCSGLSSDLMFWLGCLSSSVQPDWQRRQAICWRAAGGWVNCPRCWLERKCLAECGVPSAVAELESG